MQAEKKKLQDTKGLTDSGGCFDAVVSLAGADEDFKIALLTSQSDLSTQDIVQMVKEDKDAVNDLVMFACQVPMKPKLPAQFISKQVLRVFLVERAEALGDRLRFFRQRGGFLSGGRVSFTGNHGSYDLTMDKETGLLVEIRHISGAVAELSPKLGITKSYVMRDNYDNMRAHLLLAPLPPHPPRDAFRCEEEVGASLGLVVLREAEGVAEAGGRAPCRL